MLPFVYSAIPSLSKVLATDTRDFDIHFSALLVLKDYPREAAVPEDPSLLLVDNRNPEGKTH